LNIYVGNVHSYLSIFKVYSCSISTDISGTEFNTLLKIGMPQVVPVLPLMFPTVSSKMGADQSASIHAELLAGRWKQLSFTCFPSVGAAV